MVARSPAELCSPVSTWRHTCALSLNSTEKKKKKTSQVGLLPLAAEIALVLVPGIIHTLLTRVFRLWVVLVLRHAPGALCSLLDSHSPGKFIPKASREIAARFKAKSSEHSGKREVSFIQKNPSAVRLPRAPGDISSLPYLKRGAQPRHPQHSTWALRVARAEVPG